MICQITRASDPIGKPIMDCYMTKNQYNEAIWLRDFDKMEDLMEFVRIFGTVIVSKGKKYPLVKIYDDYVE
jgi:hypothetical protein